MIVVANILQPLVDVAEEILVFLHNDIGFGWGASIVMLTVVVRLAIAPLAVKQFHSMQALQRLQPRIKEIQAKYKDDRQRMNQEMMKFYQANKVNPLGSCLPLILQLPVFISLFYLLRNDLARHLTDTRGWLFIPDLTVKATGGALIVLILLYVVSQVGSSLLMTTTVDKTQKRMMLLLPLIFVFFIVNFPAGLVVYWITTNLWTVLQQGAIKWWVNRSGGAPVPVEAAGDDQRRPPPPPPRKRSQRRR